jgi:hypothetical protein
MQSMKRLIAGGLLLGALSARAQFFSPESAGGTLFGAATGAIIGSAAHNAGAGAAIGAGAGFLLGTVAHAANESAYYRGGVYYAAPATAVYASPQTPAPAAAPAAPAPVAVAPPSPMAQANSLFGR